MKRKGASDWVEPGKKPRSAYLRKYNGPRHAG